MSISLFCALHTHQLLCIWSRGFQVEKLEQLAQTLRALGPISFVLSSLSHGARYHFIEKFAYCLMIKTFIFVSKGYV